MNLEWWLDGENVSNPSSRQEDPLKVRIKSVNLPFQLYISIYNPAPKKPVENCLPLPCCSPPVLAQPESVYSIQIGGLFVISKGFGATTSTMFSQVATG